MWLKVALFLALCFIWASAESPVAQNTKIQDKIQDWDFKAQDPSHKHHHKGHKKGHHKSNSKSSSDESDSSESKSKESSEESHSSESKSRGSSDESSSSSSSDEYHGKKHHSKSSEGSDEKRGSKEGRHHKKRFHGGLKHKHGKHHHGLKHHKEHGHHGHHGHGKRHGGSQKQQCPKWNNWQQSECLWPADNVKLPESCTTFNLSKKIPEVVIDFYAAKIKELNDVVQTLFKSRGASKACGYCSKKIACRNRHTTSKHKGVCLPIDIKILKDECPGTDACQLSLVNGGCPPPVPQHMAVKFNKLQKLKKFGAHKAVFDFYGENHLGWGAPNEDNNSDESDSSDESGSSQSGESGESNGQTTLVILVPDVQENNATLKDYARKSSEKRNKHHLPKVPLWHCVKNKAGDKCLCCCGGYFPDVKTEKCVKVKHGNDYPVLDFPFPDQSPGQPEI